MEIRDIITQAARLGVSDIHLTAGRPPIYRINGELYPLHAEELKGKMDVINYEQIKVLTPRDADEMARAVMSESQYEQFAEKGELDFSYAIPDITRVRVNVFKQRNSTALVMRLLSTKIPSFQELNLPDVVSQLARRPKGLLLVTGPTGSGKSTTLAAMIDLINSERKVHILTLEDPIEYMHAHNLSIVNQREVGHDTRNFATALRAALREDPDVILVGEMRDLETISIAITAAETGHLVMATLHTSSAAETIDRVIDVFPPDQQNQVRSQLANTIEGIVSQQLIPRTDQPGRVVALEILIATPAIRNLIREGKTFQILSQLQTGVKFGMQTLDMALRNLVKAGIISRDVALNRAADAGSLITMI